MTGTAGGGGGDGAGPTPVRTVADRPRGRVSIGTVCARRMGTLARRDSPWVLPGVELRSPAAPLMRSGVTGNPRDSGRCRRATAATTCGLSGESMEATDLPSTSLPSLWADRREGVRELVLYLHCYPLAVAQAAEYARVYKTAAPGEYLEELKRAGLKLAKDRRRTKKGEYPVTFPEVVQLSLDKILQSDDAHAEDAGQPLRKLALVDTEAIHASP